MITNTDLLPQRYHFLLGMVKDLSLFPFDNDMKAHFGTKLCIYHEKTVSVYQIRVITKLPNSEQSYKGKVTTHNYINRQNKSTTGKL